MSNYTYSEKEMRTKKYKCRDVCPTWNREDRDCEIYGETHPTPLQCPYFAHHIKNRNDYAPTSRDIKQSGIVWRCW